MKHDKLINLLDVERGFRAVARTQSLPVARTVVNFPPCARLVGPSWSHRGLLTLIGVLANTDGRRWFCLILTGRGQAEQPLYCHLEDDRVSRPSVRDRNQNPDCACHSDSSSGLDPRMMSIKQLAQTVRYGRKVTFLVFDGEPIIGYLGGMDTEYLYVLSPTADSFQRWVISRSGSPAFELHEQSTYDDEPHRAEMENIVGPFRTWIVNRIFGRDSTRKAG